MKKCVLVVLMVLVASSTVLCELTVTWNGSVITGPALIFHDEVLTDIVGPPYTVGDPNRPGALVCRSDIGNRAGWFWPHYSFVGLPPSERDFWQVRTENNSISLLSRTTHYNAQSATDVYRNGLWTCRTGNEVISIGVFRRGSGYITSNPVISIIFPNDRSPFDFRLLGDTNGGPPTNYVWTRNNAPIRTGGSFDISIAVRGGHRNDYQNTTYRSILSVTGRLAGVYQYSVTNRAMHGSMRTDYTVQVRTSPITDVMVEQTGIERVRITWSAPSPNPSSSYHIIISSADYNRTYSAMSSPQYKTLLPGVFSIYVLALSSTEMYQIPSPVNFIMKEYRPPEVTLSLLTATSVLVSWSQPALSLPVAGYTVTVRRVTGSGLCGSTEDNRPITQNVSADTTSHMLSGLQELSNYTVSITATFITFGVASRSSSHHFTTLSAPPTEPPPRVNISTTSTSIDATWDAIDCIESNGEITGYRIDLQKQRSPALVSQWIEQNQTFTAMGLTPHTVYLFRVAGVNDNGTGPFLTTPIVTDDDIPGAVSDLVGLVTPSSAEFTWNAPEEPNGVIIGYQVTYNITNGTTYSVNTTNLNFEAPIALVSSMSSLSVAAFTRKGVGEYRELTLAMLLSLVPTVVRVEVKVESSDSVSVSWATSNFTQIAGYFIYYSQTGREFEDGVEASLFVSNSTETVVVENLLSGVEYQFQVAATTADPHGEKRIGQRSPVNIATLPADGTLIKISLGVSGLAISAAAIIVTLCSLVFITGCCIKCVYHMHSHRTKFDVKQFDETAATVPPTSTNTMELDENVYDEAIYDEVDESSKARRCSSMAIGKNAAYVKSKKK